MQYQTLLALTLAQFAALAAAVPAHSHPHPHPHPHPQPDPSTTTTATITTTGTVATTYTTGPPSAPTVVVEKCNDPTGWDWAHYPNNSSDTSLPQEFKTATPDDTGVTPTIGYRKYGGGNTTFYQSSRSVEGTAYAMNQHTYLKAPVSGQYTFNLTQGDGAAWAWVGSAAYTGWNSDNNNTGSYYASGYQNQAPYTTLLDAGQYVPIRVFVDNEIDGGSSGFAFDVKFPNGSSVPAGDFVRYDCENQDETRFPDFGEEA